MIPALIRVFSGCVALGGCFEWYVFSGISIVVAEMVFSLLIYGLAKLFLYYRFEFFLGEDKRIGASA